MIPVNYIIHGDYVVTMNDKMEIIKNGAVAVRENFIVDVGVTEKILKKYKALTVIDKTGHVILPGLINTHNHAAMIYFRGMADDMILKKWLYEYIFPVEKKCLSAEFVSAATKLACIEMMRSGTTTFADMYYFETNIARVTKEMRMRAVLGSSVLGFPTAEANNLDEYLAVADQFICEWIYDELITPAIAPQSAYACNPEDLQSVRELAIKYDVPVQIHIAETKWEEDTILATYGKRPVEHLESLGLFDAKVIGAHCVWLNDSDIEILAKHKVGVAHCISSNLKLASGIAPIVKMQQAGINVSLGTDSACSNNTQNMFVEIATAAKVHKCFANDPTVMDAKTVMYLATRGGAKVLGMDDKIGSLKPGHLADIIAIDFRKSHLTPMYDVYSHLVYAASGNDVATVMIDGKIVFDGEQLVFANKEQIIAEALEWQEKIKTRG